MNTFEQKRLFKEAHALLKRANDILDGIFKKCLEKSIKDQKDAA